MSKKIYVVTMENDEMDETEIGYASNLNVADKMIEKISNTDGFGFNEYHTYQATLDYLEINNEPISFEENPADNNLLIQFAVLWGMHMEIPSKYNPNELYKLLSKWKDEFLSQNVIEDSIDFFNTKVKNL